MQKVTSETEVTQKRFDKLIETLSDVIESDPLKALDSILVARESALALNDIESVAKFYQFEGICLFKLSRFPEALKAIYVALDEFTKLENYPVIIACQIEIGLCYMSLGDFSDGIEWLELALTNSKKHNRPKGVFTSLSNIRDAEMKLGNFEQALKYGEQSLLLAKELNSDYLIANELLELGVTHVKLGQRDFDIDPEESFKRFEVGYDLFCQARETSEKNKIYGFEVAILNAQTTVLAELGQIAQAFATSDLALHEAEHTDDPSVRADIEKTRGWLYFKTGQTAKSSIHYEKALEIYSAISKKDEIANTHRELAQVSKSSHQFAEALEHLEKFYALDAQLRSDAAERRAQALAAKLDLEKARHDAEMHRVRSEELAALNLQLQAQAVLLEKLARQDELTGLANRRRLEEFAIQAFADSRKNNTSLSMAMADLDFFKGVNDRFGHATGDDVMRVLGAVLRKVCPDGALAARFGGEEFVLILPNIKADAAFALCEKIRVMIETYNWKQLHPKLSVTISLGLSDSQDAGTHERLLSLADLRLYEAKNAGRNCTRPQHQSQTSDP